MFGPDRGEVALAGAFFAGKQHDAVGPVRPALDQRERGFIGRSLEEVVTRQAFRVRQRKCELSRLNATCHAVTPCRKKPAKPIWGLRSCSCAAPTPRDRARRKPK